MEIQRFLEKKEQRALEPQVPSVSLVFVKEEVAKGSKNKRVIKKIVKKGEDS